MLKKSAARVKDSQEKGAREAILEQMFHDFNRSRVQVYKLNFFRGIFFGFGSAFGGTVVVALVIWIVTMLAQSFPPLQDFITTVNQALQNAANPH